MWCQVDFSPIKMGPSRVAPVQLTDNLHASGLEKSCKVTDNIHPNPGIGIIVKNSDLKCSLREKRPTESCAPCRHDSFSNILAGVRSSLRICFVV